MIILQTTTLTEEQKFEVKQLLDKIQQVDESHRDPYLSNQFNKYPDMPCFFLRYENNILVGFAMIYADGATDEPVEIYMNILPEKRRTGIMTHMLLLIKSTLNQFGYKHIEYVTEANFLQKNLDFLGNLQLKIAHKEYQLRAQKPIKTPYIVDCIIRELQQEDIEQVSQFQAEAFEISIEESKKYISESYNDPDTLTYVLQKDADTIGYCAIDNNSEYYIFGLVIDYDYRNHGYGAYFIKQLMMILDHIEHKPFVLGVDDNNVAARSLYAKIGFIEETEIDYLVELK